jgi:hypothetical protein
MSDDGKEDAKDAMPEDVKDTKIDDEAMPKDEL